MACLEAIDVVAPSVNDASTQLYRHAAIVQDDADDSEFCFPLESDILALCQSSAPNLVQGMQFEALASFSGHDNARSLYVTDGGFHLLLLV